MHPVLQIGPLALQFPGLLLLLGVWAAVLLAERRARREGVHSGTLSNLIFYALIAGLVGARLGHAVRFIQLYFENPLGLLALSPTTLSLPEGLLAAGLTGWIYHYRAGLPLWPTLDALTPGLAAVMIAIGLAHIASGDAFGSPADIPWAIQLWGARRHPTQIYETLAAALIFASTLRRPTPYPFPGYTFLRFTALTAAARLFLEAFRGDSLLMLGGIRTMQVVSLAALLLALLGMHLLATRTQAADSRLGL